MGSMRVGVHNYNWNIDLIECSMRAGVHIHCNWHIDLIECSMRAGVHINGI